MSRRQQAALTGIALPSRQSPAVAISVGSQQTVPAPCHGRCSTTPAPVAMATSTATLAMADGHFSTSSWDAHDIDRAGSPTASATSHSQLEARRIGHARSSSSSSPSTTSLRGSPTSDAASTAPTAPSKSVSPQPRQSFDSPSRAFEQRGWRDSTFTLERRSTMSTIAGEGMQIVEPSFDENVLRALCDMDVSDTYHLSDEGELMPQVTLVCSPTTLRSNKAESRLLSGEWCPRRSYTWHQSL